MEEKKTEEKKAACRDGVFEKLLSQINGNLEKIITLLERKEAERAEPETIRVSKLYVPEKREKKGNQNTKKK